MHLDWQYSTAQTSRNTAVYENGYIKHEIPDSSIEVQSLKQGAYISFQLSIGCYILRQFFL